MILSKTLNHHASIMFNKQRLLNIYHVSMLCTQTPNQGSVCFWSIKEPLLATSFLTDKINPQMFTTNNVPACKTYYLN